MPATIKLSAVQLEALRAAASNDGCFVDNYQSRTWSKLHLCGFVFGGRNNQNMPVKFISTTGRRFLEEIDNNQPITEAIDFPPDGRDFGGGADF